VLPVRATDVPSLIPSVRGLKVWRYLNLTCQQDQFMEYSRLISRRALIMAHGDGAVFPDSGRLRPLVVWPFVWLMAEMMRAWDG
jgi:hypothetical protein